MRRSSCARGFAIAPSTAIAASDPAFRSAADALVRWLALDPASHERATITFTRAALPVTEGYTLDVSDERVEIVASDARGAFYGAQALAKLAGRRPIGPAGGVAQAVQATPPKTVPCLAIADRPRSGWRGMHLDVARHFFDKQAVERYLDILAFYNYNVFHWHLTDDQGFRLRLPSHPELASPDAYSTTDVREVLAYAAARGITVMPEIEMPGHSRAILAAHPELSCTGVAQPAPTTWGVFEDVLCAGNEKSYALVADVLSDVNDLFPAGADPASVFVHVGGDEVPTTRWRACPKCRAKMKELGIGPERLEGYFLSRVSNILDAKNRRMMVWDDALGFDLPMSAGVTIWHPGWERRRAAADRHHAIVEVPNDQVYFDTHQTRLFAEKGHEGYVPWWEALGAAPRIDDPTLGGEGAVWTELITNQDELDEKLLPRAAALAEALWTGERAEVPRDAVQLPHCTTAVHLCDFAERFVAQRPLLDASRIRYFIDPPYDLSAHELFFDRVEPHPAPSLLFHDATVRWTFDGTIPNAASPPVERRTFTSSADVTARTFLPDGRASLPVYARLERAVLHPPAGKLSDPYMAVDYALYPGDFHRVPDFTRLKPSRSGRAQLVALDESMGTERFAVAFDGWFEAHLPGIYRFAARADDGIVVDVDGVRVIDDDGEHAERSAEGEIALDEGFHRVHLGYFQGKGARALSFTCSHMPWQVHGAPARSPETLWDMQSCVLFVSAHFLPLGPVNP